MNLLTGVDQDFHRPQKLPGAYEWWHFDGTDGQSGYSFSIQFHAGNLFSAFYQDSLKTYWEKTKSPFAGETPGPGAPHPPVVTPPALSVSNGPNPLDYCGVSIRLFHKGGQVVESFQEFPQRSLKASDKHGAVLLGPNRFNWDERGDPPSYVLTVQAPGGKTTVRARLFFTPLIKTRPALPGAEVHSTHTWVLAAPLCHVEGRLEWVDREGESRREVAFVGKGYHDHHFGSVPLQRFVKAWHWGRAFDGDEMIVYSVQMPLEDQEKKDGLVLTFGKGGFQFKSVDFEPRQNRRNFFWLPYPKRLESTGAYSLGVDHREALSDGPVSVVFRDQVRWGGNGEDFRGSGLSNYLYTPRLSSRLFFPLLKGKSLIIQPAENSAPPPSGDVSTTRPADF